jgi:hypothetical protein
MSGVGVGRMLAGADAHGECVLPAMEIAERVKIL